MEDDSLQIQAIRARYKTSLPEKAELVAQFTSELSQDDSGNASETLELFRSELHKLAGSSGMYGYHNICDVCRHAMSAIDNNDLEELKSTAARLSELLIDRSKG